jgi:hypothetical protein
VHHPTLGELPTVAQLIADYPCPVERAAAVTALAKNRRTLSPELAQLRRDDLWAGRFRLRHTLGHLARKVGMTDSAIHKLTGTRKAAARRVEAVAA